VRFGRKVHDGIGPMLGEQLGNQRAVADISLNERVCRISLERRQGVQISCVGELVQIDHAQTISYRLKHEVRADEARSASDEECRRMGIARIHAIKIRPMMW
jgi:hypothetical protein